MIIINDKYRVPSRWEELTEKQYIALIQLLNKFECGKCNFSQFKIELTFIVLDKYIFAAENEILCENIFRISEVLTFCYKYKYNDERFQLLSSKNQSYLSKHLPGDSADPEIRIAKNFMATIEIDLCFPQQKLPKINNVPGYTFNYSSGVAETSLTAQQYINANSIVELYFKPKSNQAELLNKLVEILYPGVSHVKDDIQLAVLYNYLAIINWINKIDKYDIIFNGLKSNKKNIIGGKNLIFSISEQGYGNLSEISNLALFDFLDIILKSNIDTVHQLNSYDLKKEEIASKMNLSINQINYILS